MSGSQPVDATELSTLLNNAQVRRQAMRQRGVAGRFVLRLDANPDTVDAGYRWGPCVRRLSWPALPDKAFIEMEYRVYRQGHRFRWELADGTPVRISDGSVTWTFHRHPADSLHLPGRTDIPIRTDRVSGWPDYLMPPPAPDLNAVEDLLPVQISGPIDEGRRSVIEFTMPFSTDDQRPGTTHVVDTTTGFLIRSRADGWPWTVEWLEVVEQPELPTELFRWDGPALTIEEALTERDRNR